MGIKFRQLVALKEMVYLRQVSLELRHFYKIILLEKSSVYKEYIYTKFEKQENLRGFNSIKKFKGFDQVTIARSRDC